MMTLPHQKLRWILGEQTAPAVLVLSILLAPGASPAAAGSKLDALELRPISQAIRLVPTTRPAPSLDPAKQALAAKVRAKATEVRMRARAAHPVALGDAQHQALATLRAKVGGRLTVWARRNARTPRMIRGHTLEAAARAVAPGENRNAKTARNFLRSNRALLRLDDPDSEMVLRKKRHDELGRTHLRFRQSYRGLRVWPAEMIVHLDSQGAVDLVDGVYVETPRQIDTHPSVSATAATAHARAHVPGAGNVASPAPELFVYAPGDRPSRLAWDVSVPVSVISRWRVVVDAHSGGVLTAYDTVMTAAATGSGQDLQSQTQALNLWLDTSNYYMIDTTKPMYDPTSTPPNIKQSRGVIAIGDAAHQPPNSNPKQIPNIAQVTSANPNSGWLADAVSASKSLSSVYDYYKTVHNRDSLDGQGISLMAVVRLGIDYPNAFYMSENNMMFFGDHEPYAAALDVVGHELTHGVTAHTANLVYQKEPGALNESFSDIFGESVEAFVNGAPDWKIGSPPLSHALRDFADPSSLNTGLGTPYPSKYSEYIQTDQDNGGVHINSSIPNHAFWLLAAGLPNAVGLDKAGKIFLRALTTHLTANSQFIDARLACIQSAEELYGADSAEAQATAAAFDGVEIYDGSATGPPPTFPGTAGPDSTVFLRYDWWNDTYFLWREEMPPDPQGGAALSWFDVKESRPTVVGDGSFGVFIDSVNDICFIATNGTAQEDCLGTPGTASSVAVSPDGNVYGFILLNGTSPDNIISVIDLTKPTGQDVTDYVLRSPVLDGGSMGTVLYADAMDFSADGRLLFYDALNQIRLGSGSVIDVWSIYAIDMTTGTAFALLPPIQGLDIGYPAVSQTSDNFITFDVVDKSAGDSTIFAGDLNTGDLQQVGYTAWGFGVPSYNGDDTAVVYSTLDSATDTGFSLVSQPVGTDRITPAGSPSMWLSDAKYGAIYRRGSFVPEPDLRLLQLGALGVVWLLARRRRRL